MINDDSKTWAQSDQSDTAAFLAQLEDQLDSKMDEDLYPMEPPVYNEFTDDEIMNFIVNGSDNQPQVALRSSLEKEKLLGAVKGPEGQPPVTVKVIAPQVPINNSSTKLIEEVVNLVRQIAAQLDRLRWEQQQTPLPLQKDAFLHLDKQQKETKNAIEWAEKRLNQLIDGVVLDPREMEMCLQLLDQLFMQSRQIDLFIQELHNLQKQTMLPCATLIIISQPFPTSVKQNKNLDEMLSVRLLTSAKCDTAANNFIVRAEIMNQGQPKSKKNVIGVDNNEKLMSEGIANFSDIRFPNGTRLKSVQLKFYSKATLRDQFGLLHAIPVESNPTNHFIVKTNENQWHEAEGILLLESAFQGQTEITWPRFMNWLNRCYLIATRQNIQAPLRPLNIYDFDYLHKLKLDNSNVITQKQFEGFWAWFGPILHKTRYQRHICSLWTRGYICGFLTRDEVEAVLKNEKVGTFLIRFSERVSGMFAVAYQATETNGEKKVKHYLMKSDDTHGAKKTLPDFLGEYKDFNVILQIWFEPQTQRRILRRCDKDTVLREYYSKKPANQHEGYEDNIHVIS